MEAPTTMLHTPITADDLTASLAAVDALDDLASDADFAAWCDERRDAWVETVEATAEEH